MDAAFMNMLDTVCLCSQTGFLLSLLSIHQYMFHTKIIKLNKKNDKLFTKFVPEFCKRQDCSLQ